MRVAVAGLWHLGTVTAACCASGGHSVVAFDENSSVIHELHQNRLPVDEPGLAELMDAGSASGRLQFTSDPHDLSSSEVLWICYDTPVDEDDVPNTEYVMSRIASLLPFLRPDALVLISSQLPAGSTAKLEELPPRRRFAYSPENLRLGKAIDTFRIPDRVVVGIRDQQSKGLIDALFAPFSPPIEWMSVESAEMTKHALNAFLATSVAFMNELAGICEGVGADAQEVERGLKTDLRIGPRAYLHPGPAFAGGTLARDLSALLSLGQTFKLPVNLINGVLISNSTHRGWAERRFVKLLGNLDRRVIGVLGLTYKPGTNTLRRSDSLELCRSLARSGAIIRAFDPAFKQLPDGFNEIIHLMPTAESVLEAADGVLIATAWPQFRSISPNAFREKMRRPLVLDPARHLESILGQKEGIEYFAVGVGA